VYADAALALNRFDHDGASLIINQLSDGVEVTEGSLLETCHQRPQVFMVFGLGRRG
jgi:hypothetical protein